MKVGILTFHRALNYGAVLQCYALQEVLKAMGHEVYIIDYRQKVIERLYAPMDFRMIIGGVARSGLSYLFEVNKQSLCRKSKINAFNPFFCKYFSMDKKVVECVNDIPIDYDAYVIGSDQLWSHSTKEVDEIYWGYLKRRVKGKVISYAISTNIRYINSLSTEFLNRSLDNFDCISVREHDCAEYIQKITGKKIRECLDPTLLLSTEKWEEITNGAGENDRYVLVYEVRKSKENGNRLVDDARKLAKKMDCSVMYLDKYSACGPSDFISYIKNAQIILTSSFHGTVFSLVFRKKFWTYVLNDSTDCRYVSLLSQIGLSKRLINVNESIVPTDDGLSYVGVLDNICELKKCSLDFLNESLHS